MANCPQYGWSGWLFDKCRNIRRLDMSADYERTEMMKKLFMFVAALSLALFATSALAQTITTGSIEGTVTDPNGGTVAGVTVKVSSPNLITPQSATTDTTGHYRILNLAPGIYNVSVEGKGFAKFEKADVGVNLDRTSTLDIQLSLATATANVTVTGAAGAALDAASATTGSNVSTEQ